MSNKFYFSPSLLSFLPLLRFKRFWIMHCVPVMQALRCLISLLSYCVKGQGFMLFLISVLILAALNA